MVNHFSIMRRHPERMMRALPPFFDPLRRLSRPALNRLRCLPVLLGHGVRMGQGRGPLVVFLPSAGRTGAARLRIHDVARALPAFGWTGVVLSWRLDLAARQRLLARLCPDVIVMQGARHQLNRPALYPGVPILYDMDDADFHLPQLEQPVRRAMPEVAGVIAGSRYVARWCREAGAVRAGVVWTGTPPTGAQRPPQAGRGAVLAWAQTRPMDYRREAALVRHVVAGLGAQRQARGCGALTLRLYDRRPGDDPGFAEAFAGPGVRVEWRHSMGYDRYLSSFDDVAVGLAPLCPETPFCRGKSFGKVLACLDRKVPVIGSDACEHGAFFTPDTGVITNDATLWISAADGLLEWPRHRQLMADTAHTAFLERLTIRAAAARVAGMLNEARASAVWAPARPRDVAVQAG